MSRDFRTRARIIPFASLFACMTLGALLSSARADSPPSPALPPLPPPQTSAQNSATASATPAATHAPPKVAVRAPKPARATQQYSSAVRTWHTPTPGKSTPIDAAGRPLLTLFALNTNERVELHPSNDRGGFSAEDLDRAAHLLREPSSGNEHPVEPRTLDLVYRVQTHFSAQEIRVISGYRTPHGSSHSNHGRGRAIDLVVPGAADEAVAQFARELGFVGVGVYPTSGFVHVDVRSRSYFWVDSSGPGRKNRERGILSDLAARSDQQANARGESPIRDFTMGSDVDAELRAHGSSPNQPAPANDDDDATDGD